MVIGTAIWAGVDAKKIELRKYKTAPLGGFCGVVPAVLLLWVVAFPWYLSSRDKILSGKAKLRDEYDGEAAKEGETVLLQNSSKRKKSKLRYILGVIIAGLIFFCLFFRVVILSGDFTVIAKKHPTFSNTFVNFDDYI